MTTPKPESLEEFLKTFLAIDHRVIFKKGSTEYDDGYNLLDFAQAVAAFLEPKIREGERRRVCDNLREAIFIAEGMAGGDQLKSEDFFVLIDQQLSMEGKDG